MEVLPTAVLTWMASSEGWEEMERGEEGRREKQGSKRGTWGFGGVGGKARSESRQERQGNGVIPGRGREERFGKER